MKAFIFDLNGTMVDDMAYHAIAWKRVLNDELQGNFTDEQIKQNMYGKNPEVLVRMFGKHKFSREEMERLSQDKEEQYRREYRPHLTLLPGLADFLDNSHKAGIALAIGTAAIPANVDFVLDALNIRHYFKAIVTADDVTNSKPDPETFIKPAQIMGIDPTECMVFEDVPKGAEAAANAGMKAVILTTTHEQKDFERSSNILHFASDYNDSFIKHLV